MMETRLCLSALVGAGALLSSTIHAEPPSSRPSPSALPPVATVAATVVVHDGWVRLAPPGAKTMAAFMGWSNPGDDAVEVTDVGTTLSKRAELHTHLHEGGVMKMRQVPSIVVPAHGDTTLKPGGFHVMIFDVSKAPSVGDIVTITLTLKTGATVTATLPVLAAAPSPSSTPSSSTPAVPVPG